MTNSGIRLFLALLVGTAVMIFGTNGSDGEGPTTTLLVLSIAAGVITWYFLRPQKSGSGR